MSLLARLEAKRREVDRRVRHAVYIGSYDFEAAEMRDLLDEVLATFNPPLMFPIDDDTMWQGTEWGPGHVVYRD